MRLRASIFQDDRAVIAHAAGYNGTIAKRRDSEEAHSTRGGKEAPPHRRPDGEEFL